MQIFNWEELNALNALIAKGGGDVPDSVRKLAVKVGMLLVSMNDNGRKIDPEKLEGGFPSRLRAIRRKMRYSQQEVADKIGVSKNAIYLYEAGDNLPTLSNIIRLAKVLETDPNYLLGWDSPHKPNVAEAVQVLEGAARE